MIALSVTIQITAIKKHTQAFFFKDLKEGDLLRVELPLRRPRSLQQHPLLRVHSKRRATELTWETLCTRLKSFEYKEVL